MRRGGQILVVICIIMIMAGGILLTDNNMRELQGREKIHLSFDGFDEKVILYVKQVAKKDYLNVGSLHTWCDNVLTTSVDMISGVRETLEKRNDEQTAGSDKIYVNTFVVEHKVIISTLSALFFM